MTRGQALPIILHMKIAHPHPDADSYRTIEEPIFDSEGVPVLYPYSWSFREIADFLYRNIDPTYWGSHIEDPRRESVEWVASEAIVLYIRFGEHERFALRSPLQLPSDVFITNPSTKDALKVWSIA